MASQTDRVLSTRKLRQVPMGQKSAAERRKGRKGRKPLATRRWPGFVQKINILEFSSASGLAPVRGPETGGNGRILRADSLGAPQDLPRCTPADSKAYT